MATKKKGESQSEKLSPAQVKDLAKVGITASTMEEARTKMIDYLKKQDIDDVEDESFQELYDMVDAIYDDTEEALDAAADELDDEVEETDVDNDEEEDDEEDDDEEEDDEEEDDEPIVKKAKNESKANDKKQAKVEKKAEKKAKQTADKKPSKRLNPLQNDEDAERYAPLKSALEGDEFEFNFIANGGVSVKYCGKNSKKVFLSFDSPKVTKEGEVVGRVYLSSVKDEEVLKNLFGDDIETKKSWSGNILVVGMSVTDLAAALKKNKKAFNEVLSSLSKKDEKLGKNREKMEAELKRENAEKATKAGKTTKAKDVEEVEETQAPAKKASKKSAK
jgi:hypothetical protein